jgi:hypothetical protein
MRNLEQGFSINSSETQDNSSKAESVELGGGREALDSMLKGLFFDEGSDNNDKNKQHEQ